MAQYQAKLTTVDGMNDAGGLQGHEGAELWAHLDASDDNAVVIQLEGGHGAIWNAGGGYAVGRLPLEDPNDAEVVPRDPGAAMEALLG